MLPTLTRWLMTLLLVFSVLFSRACESTGSVDFVVSLQSNTDQHSELGNNNQHVTACNDEYIYYADGGEAIVRLDRESGAELARLPQWGVFDVAVWGEYLVATRWDGTYLLFPAGFTAKSQPIAMFDADAYLEETGEEIPFWRMPHYKPASALFGAENAGRDFEEICCGCAWTEYETAAKGKEACGTLPEECIWTDEYANRWQFSLFTDFARMEDEDTFYTKNNRSALYVRDGDLLRAGWSWEDGSRQSQMHLLWPFVYQGELCSAFTPLATAEDGAAVLTVGETEIAFCPYLGDMALLHRWWVDQANDMLYLAFLNEPIVEFEGFWFGSGPSPQGRYSNYNIAQAEGCMVTCVDLNQKHVAGSLELPYVGEAVFHADETGVYSFRAGDGRIRRTLWDGTSFLSGEQVEYESTTCEYGHTHAELYVEVSGGYAFFFHENTMGVERELENTRNISFIKAVKLG